MEQLSEVRAAIERARHALTTNRDNDAYGQGLYDGLGLAIVYIDGATVRYANAMVREAAEVFGEPV